MNNFGFKYYLRYDYFILGDFMNNRENENTKRTVVEIYGVKYPLKGVQDIEQLHRAAAMVNEEMRNLAKSSRYLPPDRLAMLVALKLADQYLNLKKDYDEFWNIFNENCSDADK